MADIHQARQIWRIRKVTETTGLPRSTIYALAAEGRFPKPVKITGCRASGWDSLAVQAWIDEQLEPTQ